MPTWTQRLSFSAVTVVGLLLASMAAGQAPAGQKADREGQQAPPKQAGKTLSKLHDVNATLLQWGALGTQKGSTPEVRDYAALVSSNHQVADGRLRELARTRDLGVGTSGSTFYELGRRIQLETLKVPAGSDFDHAYISVVTRVQREQLDELERLRATTEDPELLSLIGNQERILGNELRVGERLVGQRAAARRAPSQQLRR